ncbi:unnamed protein product [Rotaria magnacalcarata]|uniref:PLAT domain-containing protein n=2 Tax=Rotaria magnacalcarata TaxID=392030 RepID=A0A815EQR2_9BILA|nr:unnamed protein product [Rotaria magnacalcarata]
MPIDFISITIDPDDQLTSFSVVAISFNRPKLCPIAVWNSYGSTFAGQNLAGAAPLAVFVNANNTVYLANIQYSTIEVWLQGSGSPISRSVASTLLYSIFVTMTDDIYIGTGDISVDKWILNNSNNPFTLNASGPCLYVFIDTNNSLYCSLSASHQVIKRSLNSSDNNVLVVAGTGCPGFMLDMLNYPLGIFIDDNFNVYVADSNNNRIQLFQPGELNGTIMAGNGASETVILNYPTDVVLDGDGYLFIVDSGNNRIVGSGPNGFRCIVGCSGASGSGPNQLNGPQSIAFDSAGNIYVTDTQNNRLQNFALINNPCNISYNQPKLCPLATWNSAGITIVTATTIGSGPLTLFVTTNNTIYVADFFSDHIYVFLASSGNLIQTISGGPIYPYSTFITSSGDIYADSGNSSRQVLRFLLNTNTTIPIMYITDNCLDIFVDINNTIYCSVGVYNVIVAKSIVDPTSEFKIIAGVGCPGSLLDMLDYPRGIFVDTNFDLYVADANNNRIQLFQPGKINGTTVAGNGSSVAFALNFPGDVVLDADGYLFIVDSGNSRIVRSGPYGFQCIIGCLWGWGYGSNQLNSPYRMAFDSYGNIFVTDPVNSRLQKFYLNASSCDIATTEVTQPTTEYTKEDSTLIGTSTGSSTSSTSSNRPQKCYQPIITLTPANSSLSSPLQYRRSEAFSISSYIQLNCSDSLSNTNEWKISRCTSAICASQILLGQTIIATMSELYIPEQTLDYGTYQFTLTVRMFAAPQLSSSMSAYIQIIPSNIVVNLIRFGTTMITQGYQQDLILDPGSYSIDPDRITFNASNWNYEYYCRIYPDYSFPSISGTDLPLDDPRIQQLNSSCLSNQSGIYNNYYLLFYSHPYGIGLTYVGATNSPKSSLIILGYSLKSNQTCQFKVTMQNLQNSSVQGFDYLLVKVEGNQQMLIVIGCVIATLCAKNVEYQYVNPTTQVALFSTCTDNCQSINNITWNIYQGVMNTTSNVVQWTTFQNMKQYESIWFFGFNISNFTAKNNLFVSNALINYWRFEVVYSSSLQNGSSAIDFEINQPPQNGSCSINPQNGTTTTLFNILCSNWQDSDGVQGYSFQSWTVDYTQQMILAYSPVSTVQLRLPTGADNTSLLHIVVRIRDTLHCITEYNLSSVIVVADSELIDSLVDNLQTSTTGLTNHPLVQVLNSGNQNAISQVINSLSQEFNKINLESIQTIVANGIPTSNIVVSPLDSQYQPGSSTSFNASVLTEYNEQLNIYANVRDYLMTFTTDLIPTNGDSIALQATALTQLTQSPNQLTRTASMLGSEKCYQLASTLSSIATSVPYEDVQIAATQIAQCTSNVLSAINGPLQQRTNVLDLDFSRANTLPSDYDTDLESVWSNPNLFADGNDFSWETIEKNRNIYYQKQAANEICTEVEQTISLISSALNIHLNLDQSLTINTSSIFMSMETISVDSLSNKSVEQIGEARIQMPSNLQFSATNSSSLSVQSIMQPLASYGNSQSDLKTNLSRSMSLSILDQDKNEISIRTDFDNPIEIIIIRDSNFIIPPMALQNVTSFDSNPHNQLFDLYFINITSNLSISIHFEIHPLNNNLSYLFIYKFDNPPLLNSSINQIDGWTVFCPSSETFFGNIIIIDHRFNLDFTNESIYTYFIDNQKTMTHRSLIYGLRELNSTELTSFCLNSTQTSPPITNQRLNFTSDYEHRVYTSACYYLDANNNWQSDGLLVGPLTNHYQTQCLSTHLTTFASGFIVLPAPVNWNYVFANAGFVRNKTVYITLICALALYILLIIFARYKDKKDLERLGVTPLPDNHKFDQYFYQILVFTGHRRNAGTKSRVHFIVAGEDDETQIRTFADPQRRILQRGGIDAFIMAVPKSLGSLSYTHIWHDNTGEGESASWFLKYIIVRDLQTTEKFHFICQKWFAVEKGDGAIDYVLPVAGEYQKQELSYVLSKQAYHSVSDDHLWFSIFSRPPSNKFTRVQRCTCCFVLLLTSMFLNILYYDQSNDADTNTNTRSLALGPLYISPEQIGIGIIVEVLTIVPSLLLVQFFRRIQSRRAHQMSPLREAMYKIKQEPTPSSKYSYHMHFQSETTIKSSDEKKSFRLLFPWWCLFIAYGLSFIVAAISIFFIIVRGIEFGDLKTQKWLASLLSGFFSSIFLIQPIKIIILTLLFAVFMRHKNEDEQAAEFIDDDNIELNDDEEYLHSIQTESSFTYRSQTRANRLDKVDIARARDRRVKEIQMWSIIREAFTFFVFLSLLYTITYTNVNDNAFYQVNHLQKFFLNTRQITNDYTKISRISEYWNWLESSFVENIRAQEWYNGQPPSNLSGYINDRSNRLIGWATMRQLRIKPDSCKIEKPVQHLFAHCYDDYSFFNEEKQSFQPGWTNNQTSSSFNSVINRAFTYQTGDELNSSIYVGKHETYNSGGYAYEFRGRLSDLQSNLSELYQLEWIDSQTRAVLIQFSLYNPNSQFFISCNLLVEFLSSGWIEPQSRFDPISFQTFTSLFQLICSIFYMIFIISMMIEGVQSFMKMKFTYFRNLWSLIDLGIIICSWTNVGIYIWKCQESNRIGDLFQKTNGYVYISLQTAAYVHDIFIYLFGFCCFFGTIKFVHLFRFNHRSMYFIKTLQHAGRSLIAFVFMVSIIYAAFLALFYLLFISKVEQCSSILQTTQMLFEMTLLKFDVHDLCEAASLLGPICFSLFIFIVVFICVSMFVTIIRESFAFVRNEAKLKPNEDQRILSFMISKLKQWLGLSKSSELERDEDMRSRYIDPIESFPDKIDQLLDVLNQFHVEQQSNQPGEKVKLSVDDSFN